LAIGREGKPCEVRRAAIRETGAIPLPGGSEEANNEITPEGQGEEGKKKVCDQKRRDIDLQRENCASVRRCAPGGIGLHSPPKKSQNKREEVVQKGREKLERERKGVFK